ncbi:MAG: hypothetical protein ACTSWY_10950 [Promethearchaeota archaeon]
MFRRFNFRNDHSVIIKIINISVLALIFLYTLIRAFILSITYDEAYTYLGVVLGGHIFVANNHILNTILVGILTYFFGNTEIILRIPALMGCFLYLIGTYKLSNLIFNKSVFSIILVLALTLNSLLLDLFTLCRGYALSLGLMMMGLYFFFKRLLNIGSIRKNNFYSFSFLGLSITAIYTFITIFLAVVTISIYLELKLILSTTTPEKYDNLSCIKKLGYIIKKASNNILIPLILNFIIIILATGFYAYPILRYFSGGRVTGKRSFESFINNLINASIPINLFNIDRSILFVIAHILITLSVIIFFIVFIHKLLNIYYKKDSSNTESKITFSTSSLLFITIAMIYLQVFALDLFNIIFLNKSEIIFPRARTGVFIIPLYTLFLITLWKYILDKIIIHLKQNYKSKPDINIKKFMKKSKISLVLILYASQIYFGSFIFFTVSNGINTMNFTHTYLFYSDAPIKSVILDLIELNPNEETIHLKLGNKNRAVACLYYKRIYDLDWLKINIEKKKPPNDQKAYDYYLLSWEQIGEYGLTNYKIVKYYPAGDVYLINV